MRVGTRVRLVTEKYPLGAMNHRDGGYFVAEVPSGTEGTYEGAHTTIDEDGWHWVRVEPDLWVPCGLHNITPL